MKHNLAKRRNPHFGYTSFQRKRFGIRSILLFVLLQICIPLLSQTYTYSYVPAMGSYTSTGSGTSSFPKINYSGNSLAGGVTDYTNGQIKATVYSHSSGTITFRVAKTSGYFKSGNSGKVFILDNYYGDIYATSFSISNSTTSYVTARISGYGDFTGSRTFRVFLITSDQVYKQHGGLITITGSKSQLPPTVQTYEPTNITSNSAKFSGVVNPNGSSTTYYFKYGQSSSMNQRTSSKTISASSGATNVSVTVSDLSSDSYYYVQLWAENSGGTSRGDSYTFYTQPASNNPPSVPTNPSPAVASTDQPTSGTLSWSCSDPDGDAITYKVYLGTSTSNMNLYKTTTSRSCAYSLEPATRYYWYVTASDGNQSSTGQTWNFKTKSNLGRPTNPSPADRSKDVPLSGTFSWDGNNASGVTYTVYLGTSSVSLSKYKSTKNTYVNYEGLEASQNYFWKVEVTDGNETDNSALWQFSTVSSNIGDCDFADVPKTNNFYEPTCYLYKLSVLSGSDVNGKMDVESNLTRAHLAKIAFRGVYSIKGRTVPASVPSDYYPTVYSDLTDNSTYYYQAARALLYLEYGDGISPFDRDRIQFSPSETITRLHTLKVLMETFNIKPSNNDYVAKAIELGIITTNKSTFRPNDNCLRGEAFTMLANIMQKIDNGQISDPNPGVADYFEPLNTTLKTIALGTSLPMGNFQHYTKTSFSMSGVVPLAFTHTYNSYNTTLPEVFYGAKAVNDITETYQPLGDGWSHNYHTFITVVGKFVSGSDDNGLRAIVHWGGGRMDVYKSNGSELVPESYGVYDQLYSDGSDYVVKTKDQMEYRFSRLNSTGASVLYLISVTDRNGNTLTLNYESGENGSKRISSVSDGSRSLTFFYLSGTNLVSRVSDPLGRNIKMGYQLNNHTGRYQLISFTDAKGQTTNYTYGDDTKVSTSKLLTRIQLPKGNYIENEYDANRRLNKTVSGKNGIPKTQTSVRVTASYSGSATTRSTVNVVRNGSNTSTYNYTFNANNSMTKMVENGGLQMSCTYGNSKHPQLPTSMVTNSSKVSNITYDEKGNTTSITVGDGETLTTTMTYDSKNNLTSVTDPKGNKTTYSYDSKGNLTSVSAPEGVSSSMSVNSKGLATSFTDPMGVRTELGYNEFGNLTQTRLPALGLTSTANYDGASRLTESTDALGRIVSYAYDNNDNLTSDMDAERHTTRYTYDANDNLTTITNAKGGVTTMSYDYSTDWLTSVSFAGASKLYGYNEDGSLASVSKPDGTKLEYVYDQLGRVTDDGVRQYEYDDQLRLSAISENDKKLSFQYDSFNRINYTRYDHRELSGGKVGTQVWYEYDANGNTTQIKSVYNYKVTYTFDGLNRMTSMSFNNGNTISYTYRKDSKLSRVSYPNGMTTSYSYDEVGRLTGKRTTLSNGNVVASYSFERDNVGNIVRQTANEPYTKVSLAKEDVIYSYNEGNRITKAGDTSFEFDANGNTIKRGDEQYVWDKDDRLTEAKGCKYDYDPLGYISQMGFDGQNSREYVVDVVNNGNILIDITETSFFYYGATGLEARIANMAYFYVTDLRGSVVAIVDENGNIVNRYQYDDFGRVVQSEEKFFNPFRYVGQHGVMYSADNRYYMRARFYDPTIGRFLSEDPIWSTNLYPYADNNPIMGIDPQGTSTWFGNFVDFIDKGIDAGVNVWDKTLDELAYNIYKYGGDEVVDIMEKIANGTYVGTQQWKYLLEQSYDLMESGYVEKNEWKQNVGSVLYLICSAWQEDTWLNTAQTVIAGDNLMTSVKANGHNIMTDILGKTKGLGLVDMRTKLGRTIKAIYAIEEGGKTIYKNYNQFQENLRTNNSWGNFKMVTKKWQ